VSRCVFARGLDDRVCCFDATGQKVWEQAVDAGRFPVPPTYAGGGVYVCSNRGLLSVLDAAIGRTRMRYQVTPGSYVMAPVAVEGGACYVAGMDGTLTALRVPGSE
jgi:outer membrane protein assembly factor BamB